MNKSIKFISIGIVLILAVFLIDVCAQDSKTNPITNSGKKWQIGYVEGGAYANYQSILKHMIREWMDLGWIQPASIPKCQDDRETITLWNFLSTEIKSVYLEFPAENYWTSKWDDNKRLDQRKNILNRLNSKNCIDLLLCFGTWAGQDFANDEHKIPTMVLSASNAIRSGIIKSADDSGFDHVHAWIDSTKSERQLRLFHEITGFKKLGLAYENDLDGRSYAATEDVLKLSQELGFQVIECHLPLLSDGTTNEEIELSNCYEKLAENVDAIYVTDYAGLTKNNITKLLSPLFKHKVANFAQTRYDLVKYGILMGVGRASFKADAKFYTQIFTKILNGSKPRDLPQKFESPLDIVINLESAKKIGFRFPIDILAGASLIHKTIENTDN